MNLQFYMTPGSCSTAIHILLEELERVFECGDFGIADTALFYNLFWAERCEISLPPNCGAHYRQMLTRPAVRQVMAEEGCRSLLKRHGNE